MDYSNIGNAIQSAKTKTKNVADDFVSALNRTLLTLKHQISKDQQVRMLYGGAFGIFRALRIGVATEDFVYLFVVDQNGEESELITHVSQCSVQFIVFAPASDQQREDEVKIMGFSAEIRKNA